MSHEENKEIPHTKMGSDWCPVCMTFLDAVTSIDKENYVPSPDDISICSLCGSLLKFSKDMALVEMPPQEFIKLATEQKLYLLKAQWHAVKFISERINGKVS